MLKYKYMKITPSQRVAIWVTRISIVGGLAYSFNLMLALLKKIF